MYKRQIQFHFSPVAYVDASGLHGSIQEQERDEHHHTDYKEAGEEGDLSTLVAKRPEQPRVKTLHGPPHFQ